MTSTGPTPDLVWLEPWDWLVAFGPVDPAVFLAEARRQRLLPGDLGLSDDEILLETLHIRPDGTTPEGDPLWRDCAADHRDAQLVTVWRG